MNREEKISQWQEKIQRQRESGLSQMHWCQEQEISISTFRYWVKRLKDLEGEPEETTWVSLKSTGNQQAVASLRLLIGDLVVEVSPGFDPSALDNLISVLRKYA